MRLSENAKNNPIVKELEMELQAEETEKKKEKISGLLRELAAAEKVVERLSSKIDDILDE